MFEIDDHPVRIGSMDLTELTGRPFTKGALKIREYDDFVRGALWTESWRRLHVYMVQHDRAAERKQQQRTSGRGCQKGSLCGTATHR